MPSSLLAEDKDDPCPDTKPNEEPKKTASPDSSPGKLSPMKAFGNKIKEETKRLVRYPGKALKRPCDDEDEEEEAQIQEDFTCFFKEHDILMEFKYLSKNPPSGVYVIPSIKSLQVWHGIIFLRAGPFQEGIFRFDVLLPDNFPNSAPLVRFTSHVFHPQIHINGILNIEQAFPCWKKGENHICDVLNYVKSCFYNLNTSGALNEEAANCINDDLNEFKITARECVKQSLYEFEKENVITPEDDGNLLKIKSFSTPLFNEWKQKLLCKEPSTSHAT